ncbi:hypothetical protein RhiirA5_437835 [Rhizophagus irregularis]|uniref:MULE transposase domain-containing protein n=1 Tax=Rhizophagus irregularis TaxID=588596 RepID=A0A2N0NJZ1_9GLOM|nr:hypothetical protein RhiirA5_437835 [Rhizophagus irregularis]
MNILSKKTNLQEFMRTHCQIHHYSFQIKKCENADCNVNGISFLPDPVPAQLDNDRYTDFKSIYGTETTEQYCPTLIAAMLNSEQAPSTIFQSIFKCIVDDWDYSCGSSLVPESHELYNVLFDYKTSDNEDELVELTDSLELIAGLTFNSWNEFKSWINRFALKEGFSYKIRSSEKIEGVIRRVAYECIKSGSNTSQVTSDPTKRRNASSSKTSCPWKLNVTYPKTSGVIKINSFNNEHNHSLTSIHDYSDQPIYKKDLYNAKDSNLLWIVKLWLDPVSRKLKSLLWILPTQKELYNKYNNVTIIDTTYNTNRFQMMLCIIAIVDNNYKSRIVATAIIDNETLNTYRWLFNTILTEIGISPGVIFTDSDPSMIQSQLKKFM